MRLIPLRTICAALVSCLIVVVSAPKGDCVAQQVLQEGGPYLSKEPTSLQKFSATLVVPVEQQSAPLYLTFYNGYRSRPGFSWVRVFLSSGNEAPGAYGQVLADEHTFLRKSAVTVDVSGAITPEKNQLFIEGEGIKGAEFSWVLSTVKYSLSVLDSSPVMPGKECLIHGTGFSATPEENKVMIDGKPAAVIDATPRMLTVKAPQDITSTSNVPITVSIGSNTSNSIRAAIGTLPPRLLSISPYGGPPGGTLNIRGNNFARDPAGNVVMIGPYKAQVQQVVNGEMLLVAIPNWGSSTGTLPVRVISNGVPSSNQLQFWCISRYYGGDPNANVYGYD